MSIRMFSQKQIKSLLKNKNVFKCSEKSITYSSKFKIEAVKRYYDEGMTPTQIFLKAGFDLSVIGKEIPKYCLARWRKNYNIKGLSGLAKENRGQSKSGGRPRTKGLTDKENIERLEATVAYLKAENDFLAKLRAAKKE